jgi:hypothetical protein
MTVVAALSLICAVQAFGQSFNGSTSDLWATATNWTPNTVPNSSTANAIINNTTGNIGAELDFGATVATLTLGASNSLTIDNGSSLTVNGGPISNAGTITQNSSGYSTDLIISSGTSVSLTGGGVLSLSNNTNNRIYGYGDASLTNVNNTIQGSGQIGVVGGFSLINESVVNANQSAALEIYNGSVTNTGTLEATSGGTLNLSGITVTNTGGLVLSSGTGSVVTLTGSTTITGGNLTTSSGGSIQNNGSATLNNATITSGSTYTDVNGNSTTLAGTTLTNNGTLALNSNGYDTDLIITNGTNVDLNGSGSVVMSNNANNRIYGYGNASLTNNQTISGAGQIGVVGGFTLINNGTVNANVSTTLEINDTVNNTGILEATSGGTLLLYDGAVTNTGAGEILAGAGSTVSLSGETINGGLLTGPGTLQNTGGVTLNGVTIDTGTTFTATNGEETTLDAGTITNNGNLALNSTGYTTDLIIAAGASVTLSGSGALVMSNNANNRIYGYSGASLTNNQTISGAGQIGVVGGFILNNNGTVNANVSNALTIDDTINNTGTLEATAGGTLTLTGAAVTGGTILSSGAGSVVNMDNGSVISGSTLTTSGGGVMQHTSGTATFDGVTITSGSTLTLGNGATTTLAGTIANNGTIFQNSTGYTTDVLINGTVTLDGNGTYSMSNNFNNRVYSNGSGELINGVNHTIQGSGQLGIGAGGNGFTLVNDGTIIANQSVELQVDPGIVTNNGTFQVNAGSTMVVGTGLTNFSGDTLTGGSYIVAGTVLQPGTMQLTSLGSTGGEIVQNAATVVLDGPTAQITDDANRNALSAFQDNLAAGSFTVEGGQLFSTIPAGDFTNAGAVDVGADSSFTTSTNYNQTGGTTQVDGTLTAAGGQINIDGGVLSGLGTAVATTLTIGSNGTLSPGDPGDFNVIGNLLLPGTDDEQIAGAAIGSFDRVLVTGTADVAGGNLDISLLASYVPQAGTTFDILQSAALSGTFATADGVAIVGDAFTADGERFTIDYTADDVILDAVGSATTATTPEPGFYVPLLTGIAVMIGIKVRRRRQDAAIHFVA